MKGLAKHYLINSFVYLVSGLQRFRKLVENSPFSTSWRHIGLAAAQT